MLFISAPSGPSPKVQLFISQRIPVCREIFDILATCAYGDEFCHLIMGFSPEGAYLLLLGEWKSIFFIKALCKFDEDILKIPLLPMNSFYLTMPTFLWMTPPTIRPCCKVYSLRFDNHIKGTSKHTTRGFVVCLGEKLILTKEVPYERIIRRF